jgi:hypothetical protein
MASSPNQPINGILLLYHHSLRQNAATIMEHITAFERHSQFRVWRLNTELGFPGQLADLRFRIIVLHYSLFGTGRYYLNAQFLDYLAYCEHSYKIAFFQDEFRYCQKRFEFLNRYRVDCVYTLIEPAYFKDVYQKYTSVPKLVYSLAGYVSDDLLAAAPKYTKPDHERTIDVGYRGRRLAFYMGKGAQEKREIGVEFEARSQGLGLTLDIEDEEQKRIYGDAWYEFIANCRAVLGVEAGVSVFDLEDKVRVECERLLAFNPNMSFDEISARVLAPWENNVYYRTISPRHFEAAAFRVCQILFEGSYSGLMQPMVHFIPLKKDFSNFDEVIRLMRDDEVRQRLTENAYRDLIGSGKYTYRRFIEEFDQEMLRAGFTPQCASDEAMRIDKLLAHGAAYRQIRAQVRETLQRLTYSNPTLRAWAKPGITLYRRTRIRLRGK